MSRYFIEVVDIDEHEDGSATISIDMSHDAMRAFAAAGIHKALMDMAKQGEDVCGYFDTEGTSNGPTGAVGSDYVPGKV